MVDVIVDSGFMDLLIILVGALFIVLIIFLGIYAYQNYVTPKEAKETTKSKKKKLALILTAGLGHMADLFSVTEVIPEGVFEAVSGKKVKKQILRFQVPRKINIDGLEVAEGKDSAITTEVLQHVLNLNSEKVILRDARSPLFIAVRDKTVAAGIKGIGALAFLDKLESLTKIKEKIGVMKNVEGFKELGELLERFESKVSLIDFDVIRTNLALGWDQSIDESLREHDEELGKRKVLKGKDDFKTLCLYMGVLLIGVAMLIAVVWMVTSGSGGGT